MGNANVAARMAAGYDENEDLIKEKESTLNTNPSAPAFLNCKISFFICSNSTFE